jgi:hypothetical protein
MESKERRSLEFKALQDEMLENSRKIYQIITSTIALCAGLIGYCFGPAHFPIVWARPFALLSPFLILIPATILIQSNQLSTVRMAAFLRVAFEEYQNQELPGWQSAMQWSRERKGPRRTKRTKRTKRAKKTMRRRCLFFKRRVSELTFLVDPATSGGRHLHVGLRGILCGIAIASSLGSAVAWWWLMHHEHMLDHHHQHFWTIMRWYLASLLLAWWLFLLAYRDMRDGWGKNRFAEWQKHWQRWARKNVKHQIVEPSEAVLQKEAAGIKP